MSDAISIRLPAEPGSASEARRFIRSQATLDSMRHAEADLLVTELIANVIQHSPQTEKFVLTLEHDPPHDLVISVSHLLPYPLESPKQGAGFTLLDRLARRWSHSHDGKQLTVSFVLRTPGTTTVTSDITDERLFERMAEDPAAYSDELVRRHSDLATSIARRYRGKGIDEDDLFQVAQMALLKAIQRYDPAAGTIRPYAAATISGEMKKLLRDRGWSVRVPRSLQERSLEVANAAETMVQRLGRLPTTGELAEHLDMPEDEVDEALRARHAYVSNSMDKRSDDTGRNLFERMEDEDLHLNSADDRLVIEAAISQLPVRKQQILHLRFNRDLTQAEIADEVGISQMHVSRLLSNAMDELRALIDHSASTE